MKNKPKSESYEEVKAFVEEVLSNPPVGAAIDDVVRWRVLRRRYL